MFTEEYYEGYYHWANNIGWNQNLSALRRKVCAEGYNTVCFELASQCHSDC